MNLQQRIGDFVTRAVLRSKLLTRIALHVALHPRFLPWLLRDDRFPGRLLGNADAWQAFNQTLNNDQVRKKHLETAFDRFAGLVLNDKRLANALGRQEIGRAHV